MAWHQNNEGTQLLTLAYCDSWDSPFPASSLLEKIQGSLRIPTTADSVSCRTQGSKARHVQSRGRKPHTLQQGRSEAAKSFLLAPVKICRVFASSSVPARALQEPSTGICKSISAPSEVSISNHVLNLYRIVPSTAYMALKEINPAVKRLFCTEKSIRNSRKSQRTTLIFY